MIAGIAVGVAVLALLIAIGSVAVYRDIDARQARTAAYARRVDAQAGARLAKLEAVAHPPVTAVPDADELEQTLARHGRRLDMHSSRLDEFEKIAGLHDMRLNLIERAGTRDGALCACEPGAAYNPDCPVHFPPLGAIDEYETG